MNEFDVVARFAALPGIDVAKGIDTWGDFGEYRKFLMNFALDYADCADAFAALLGTGELDEAVALIHKLKGGAGTLALTEVYQVTREIDACADGVSPLHLLPRLRSALDTAMASIALLGAYRPA
jgi:HPt (histidine-containing phosphotransfer) domain-containing protein